MKSDITTLFGKRVVGAVYKEAKRGHRPMSQIFLLLDDGNHFEFYAPESEIVASGVKMGGLEQVLNYMESTMETKYVGGLDANANQT